jgi:ADP-dependent NAD(P)H-hydrate dehydratase / NAD(P)H-hydrate epimerase
MLIVTAEEMRRLDHSTIHEAGIPGIVLMENAGRSLVQIILDRFFPLNGKFICIFAGRGNNGGDGFVVARYLQKEGCSVRVYLLSPTHLVAGDAKTNLEICQKLQVPIHEILVSQDVEKYKLDWLQADLVVDALLGTGLNADVRSLYAEVIDVINGLGAPKVAVDIPSGLDSERGTVLGTCVKADLTVTFGFPKIGQVIYPGREYVGELHVVDISIPRQLIIAQQLRHVLLEPDELTLPTPRKADSHKGHFGHLLVIAGSPGKTGAAAMTSEAAVRVGAGLVTLGVPKSLNPILEAKLTEVMTEPLAENVDGVLSPDALQGILKIVESKTALALGPGLSTAEGPAELIRQLLVKSSLPIVIDADGLNIVAKDMNVLQQAQCPIILTPHPGEMARLTGIPVPQVQSDRIGVSRLLAQKFKVIVVLKGAATVVALPDGQVFINPTGNPGMASGGMGDILTGLIGGLLAQGLQPEEAAKTGVFMHGLAGDYCARKRGPTGFLATDLLPEIPSVLAELTKERNPRRPSIFLISGVPETY